MLISDHPGHHLYDMGSVVRSEASGPQLASTLCHELMLDPDYEFPSPLARRFDMLEAMDLCVVKQDLAYMIPDFESMYVLLDYQVQFVRFCVGAESDDTSTLLTSPDDTIRAFMRKMSPVVVLEPFFNDMMTCYGKLHLSDKHVTKLLAEGEMCIFRDYLITLLGSDAVPSFSDVMARSKTAFEGKMKRIRIHWEGFHGPLNELWGKNIVDFWGEGIGFLG